MPSQIGKLKYVFLGLFFVISASLVTYGWMYGIPKRKCEAAGGWYTFKYHTCSAPVYLPSITHRKPGDPATVDFHEDSKKASNAVAVEQAPAPASASN